MSSIQNLPVIRALLATPVYQRFSTLPPLGQKLVLVGSLTFLVSVILTLVYFFVDRIIAIGSLSTKR
jgi:hypothetical protein